MRRFHRHGQQRRSQHAVGTLLPAQRQLSPDGHPGAFPVCVRTVRISVKVRLPGRLQNRRSRSLAEAAHLHVAFHDGITQRGLAITGDYHMAVTAHFTIVVTSRPWLQNREQKP